MSEVETFGFEKDDIKGGTYEKYKGKKGEVHRLGVIYTDPKSMFAGSKVHYKDRYFLCKKGICCDKCGPARWRVGAVLVKYATTKDGQLKKEFSYELYPWMFSETTFSKLRNVNNEFPLPSHDIQISCENDDYQHLNITPCKESIWQAKDELKKRILNEAKPIWDYVKKGIASDLSIEEIKDLLGLGTEAEDPTSSVDLDSVLDQV